jgi:hypothetical protein
MYRICDRGDRSDHWDINRFANHLRDEFVAGSDAFNGKDKVPSIPVPSPTSPHDCFHASEAWFLGPNAPCTLTVY